MKNRLSGLTSGYDAVCNLQLLQRG